MNALESTSVGSQREEVESLPAGFTPLRQPVPAPPQPTPESKRRERPRRTLFIVVVLLLAWLGFTVNSLINDINHELETINARISSPSWGKNMSLRYNSARSQSEPQRQPNSL